MSNPAAAPRRVFLMCVVMLTLIVLVALLYTGRLIPAVVVGLVGVALLVAGARPQRA